MSAKTDQQSVVKITNPAGESRTILVKLSVIIELEEQTGMPVLLRSQQGYAGPALRISYKVGRDNGIIPPDVSFADFVDDDAWLIDYSPTESPVADAEGNA